MKNTTQNLIDTFHAVCEPDFGELKIWGLAAVAQLQRQQTLIHEIKNGFIGTREVLDAIETKLNVLVDREERIDEDNQDLVFVEDSTNSTWMIIEKDSSMSIVRKLDCALTKAKSGCKVLPL